MDSLKMLLCSENELYELNKHKKIRYVLNKADRSTGGQDWIPSQLNLIET